MVSKVTTVAGSPQDDIKYNQLGGLKTKEAETHDVDMTQTAPSDTAKASDNVAQGQTTDMQGQTQDMSDESSSAYRAKDIMSEKSPLMRMAKQEGMLTAAKRGLGNSSIAAGNAQAAMSKAAVPLAQQDAKQSQTQDLANQRNLQEAEKVNVTESNDMTTTNVKARNDANILDTTETNDMQTQFDDRVFSADTANALARNKASIAKFTGDQEIMKTWMDGKISTNLTHLQGQYNEVLSGSSTVASMFNSTQDMLASMWANPDVPISIANRRGESAMRFLEGVLQVQGSILGMDYKTDMPSGSS